MLLITFQSTASGKEAAMAKIKIKDLPKDLKIGEEELRRVRGGQRTLSMRELQTARDLRTQRLKSFAQVDRFILPNMMHDAGP